MPAKRPGRPKGSKNAVDVVVVERSHPAAVASVLWRRGGAKEACPKCGSPCRSEYWGRVVQKCPGLRADGTPYSSIIRRRCRCLDCGQVRIDKEYG
jgi:hypothetical protein